MTTVAELVQRLKDAKAGKPDLAEWYNAAKADQPKRDYSHLDDPDLITRLMGEPVVGDDGEAAPVEAKRKRRPSSTYAARLAKREGVEVKLAPDGTMTMKPVNNTLNIAANDDADSFNEWDTVQ